MIGALVVILLMGGVLAVYVLLQWGMGSEFRDHEKLQRAKAAWAKSITGQ